MPADTSADMGIRRVRTGGMHMDGDSNQAQMLVDEDAVAEQAALLASFESLNVAGGGMQPASAGWRGPRNSTRHRGSFVYHLDSDIENVSTSGEASCGTSLRESGPYSSLSPHNVILETHLDITFMSLRYYILTHTHTHTPRRSASTRKPWCRPARPRS